MQIRRFNKVFRSLPHVHFYPVWIRLLRAMRLTLVLALGALVLTYSFALSTGPYEQVRRYTRSIEFDYVNWTLQALFTKAGQAALNLTGYLPDDQQRLVVGQNLRLTAELQSLRHAIELVYIDPSVSDPARQAAPLFTELRRLEAEQAQVGPLAETVLQQQVGDMVAQAGLTLGGQTLPPLLYHSTELPKALIVSPRDAIRQDANISLLADLSLEEITALEQAVESDPNRSALVVPIGGVGIYPTMVISSTNLPYLLEVVAHEWIHNYLTTRPLGLNYETSPELRTINETVASIAGKEIGNMALEKYYPEFLPHPAPDPAPPVDQQPVPLEEQAPAFDFQAAMHATRVQVDQLLAAGQVEEAESYMQVRRQFFLANGYEIRRLNQAYFAFYGAYADSAVGAAGEDPVGAAVREMRRRSPSLADFVNQMSWMSSYADLQAALGEH
ncbi:MAG: hypothetical protein VB089_21465 [Anaerolineaceae bacterium]|nr:hypothetical protein [Anaerolineaceae bacterium]